MDVSQAQSRLFSVAPRRLRHFTVEQANRSLVLIRRVVADIIMEYQEMLDLNEVVEAAVGSGSATEIDRCRKKLVETVERLQQCIEELYDVGVELRDWSLGVVDFPAIAGGREVYLCWQFGEPRVMFWHEQSVGDGGRQPVETLPLACTSKAG